MKSSVKERFDKWHRKDASGCWLWVGTKNRLGYGVLHTETQSKAHRVSWEIHNGLIPEGMMVLHKCDVRDCVNPDHLFLGTQKDNVRDMMKKGRNNQQGLHFEEHPGAKLTKAQVTEMRELRYSSSLSYREISKRFGVSSMTAYRAITRQLWDF